MPIQITKSADRFGFQEGWLETKWHFSFGHYQDPQNVQFGHLRVFNDDVVAPASGFDTHPHKEMEIVTIMLRGQLEHKDSTGGHGIIKTGDIQRMSAGTGVQHSEKNPSPVKPCSLLQIWILPDTPRLPPGYEQKSFDPAGWKGKFQRLIAPDPGPGELKIHQDASFHRALLTDKDKVVFPASAERRQYAFVIDGVLHLNELDLQKGDQARITKTGPLTFKGGPIPGDVLLIDLP